MSACMSFEFHKVIQWWAAHHEIILRVAGAAGQAMLGLHGALSLLGAGMRGKPRRGMLRRAVFSDFQRKGLEKVFQKQKYISKPDRKKLAEKLGLKDSQVFVRDAHIV